VLTPAQVRAALVSTGAPQQAGGNPVSQNIGPRPNVVAAVAQVFGNRDCDGNQVPDEIEIYSTPSLDGNLNGIPDACECVGDYNGDTQVDGDDVIEFFADWDAGQIAADVNNDGGVDGDDVLVFFGGWDAGC
jgi:hypothetical protein